VEETGQPNAHGRLREAVEMTVGVGGMQFFFDYYVLYICCIFPI
jgi:hypothetical protein